MRTLVSVREAGLFARQAAQPLVLVPTMGALHTGHAALVAAARRIAGPEGTVVVSIFVNPTQFGPGEDFTRYPRTPEADLEVCRAEGADAVFLPTAEDLYPPGASTFVDETELSRGLCGSHRPGHFRGVCTVVAKLFVILRPAAAVFGEKDYQQLAVIRRMVRDLFLGVDVIGHPTVREADGLALSSRNRYLDADARERAARFAAALRDTATACAGDPAGAAAAAKTAIRESAGCDAEYVEAVDAETLESPPAAGRPAVLAAAIRLGGTRLIDNVRLGPPHGTV
jgi:pantoate--beta-alanine ligase